MCRSVCRPLSGQWRSTWSVRDFLKTLVLLPLALAPMGVLLACLRERLDGGTGGARVPSGAPVG